MSPNQVRKPIVQFVCLAVGVVAFLAGSGTASAQTTGKVIGTVTDQDTGQPLVGAQVVVEGTNLGNVILDLDLPDADDFDPRTLHDRDPATVLILTTANEHANPRPVHLHVFDNLLKPFDSKRFDRVLGRSAAYLGKGDRLHGQHLRLLAAFPQDDEEGSESSSRSSRYANRLLVRDGDRIPFVKVEDIDWIEAGGGCARVHCGGRVHLLAEGIEELACRLDPRQFLRVRRSLLVNLDRIEPMEAVP